MTDAGIYIHIPYCVKKCAYCDFYSLPDITTADAYQAVLLSHIKDEGARRGDMSVSSVFFGGGTPTYFGASRLCALLEEIKTSFHITDECEISVEANPKTASRDDFSSLAASGVNRVSIGVQSADETELKMLGRIHTPSDAAKAVSDARGAGIENINIDLMYGIPEQTAASLEKSLDFALSLGVSHVSAYALSIEENTPFYAARDALKLPDEREQFEMYALINQKLSEAGIKRYEISNFAQSGCESRHNLKYWRGVDYLGFGAAASSCVGGRRYTYERSISDYISSRKLSEDVRPTDYDREFEFIMLRLRLAEGVEKAEYNRLFGKNFDLLYGKTVKELCAHGLTVDRGGRVFLTLNGVFVSNSVICALLDNLKET